MAKNRLESRMRKELQNVPMPDKTWEDRIYALAMTELTDKLPEDIPKESGFSKSDIKSHNNNDSNSTNYVGWWLSGILDTFASRTYTPIALSFLLLGGVMFLQPLNSLYEQRVVANDAQTLNYLEELVAFDPGYDILAEGGVDLSANADALWDDSWLLSN